LHIYFLVGLKNKCNWYYIQIHLRNAKQLKQV
jgi:hypothetical protein